MKLGTMTREQKQAIVDSLQHLLCEFEDYREALQLLSEVLVDTLYGNRLIEKDKFLDYMSKQWDWAVKLEKDESPQVVSSLRMTEKPTLQ